jgi:hypothetical protein
VAIKRLINRYLPVVFWLVGRIFKPVNQLINPMIISAILIDPTRQTIESIELDNSLAGFYDTLHCETIASYGRLANGDVATGDDEALLAGPTPLFWFGRYPLPLGGRVVITHVDAEGESINPRSSVDSIKSVVRFIPEAQTESLFEQYHGHLC